MDWTRTKDDIPTWELAADPDYYVEQWGLGSWAAYFGDVRIGEPGSYGARDEAQNAAEAQYRAEGPVQFARCVFENYRALSLLSPASTSLAELARRSYAALEEALADSAEGIPLGKMSPEQKAAVIKRAAARLQAELQAAAPAIAAALADADVAELNAIRTEQES